MKKIICLLSFLAFGLAVLSQNNNGNKGKGKTKNNPVVVDKSKDKGDKEKSDFDDHNRKVWEGTSDKGGGGPKISKNQPAKVKAAFQRDYPGASNVYWTKYRGDWTATFGYGFFRSTAVYHANGDRRDTRTPVLQDKIPGVIIDIFKKRFPGTKIDGAIKIEVPNLVKDIFRIKNIIEGKPVYEYYNSDGVNIQYNY
jgi:hypothetical protein